MNRVVIAARTNMHGGHVCIGGHDLDRDFRPVRLLDLYGDHWTTESPYAVGDIWGIRYRPKVSARPPHVEDVFVQEQKPFGAVADLKRLVLRNIHPWCGPPTILFEGTVRLTGTGSPYISPRGRLPQCSTGYWLPDRTLDRRCIRDRARFGWATQDSVFWCTWVGVQRPPAQIEAGSLVRVSLSRLFRSESSPEGYYMQLSGVLP